MSQEDYDSGYLQGRVHQIADEIITVARETTKALTYANKVAEDLVRKIDEMTRRVEGISSR